eukprot:TRINITY_DN11668_c0_g2_i1.p1 TRINITY_DN11668_c0_g2~~TRINITY_DN11668_c0_g2_i1.p1  ORF type:complete len:261 (+),score=55.38 TRINITY_DN11668_c0_g2_i1:499-1281(+)
MRVLEKDDAVGWAVVNKPSGVHTSPQGNGRLKNLTFQDYLPALLPPPPVGTGIRCRAPKACHRLDYRVSGPVVVATTEEAMLDIKLAFQERRVFKEYRAIVCGQVGKSGEGFSIDSPIDGRAANTAVDVLRVARCPHFGYLTELRLYPHTGRYHQLRIHCSEVLGAPIVNEDEPLFAKAAEAWQRRTSELLPKSVDRARGNLFLQAVKVVFPRPRSASDAPPVSVEVAVSDRFDELMETSQQAWDRGWRPGDDGIPTKSG